MTLHERHVVQTTLLPSEEDTPEGPFQNVYEYQPWFGTFTNTNNGSRPEELLLTNKKIRVTILTPRSSVESTTTTLGI